MSEIDVTKCEYYDDYHKDCSNYSYLSDDKPYCSPSELKCSYYIRHIEQQLQQLKEDYAELLNRHNASFDNFKQLKAENEELKERASFINADRCAEIMRYKQCLDECLSLIEKEVNPYDTLLIIKNNIKEVLENE